MESELKKSRKSYSELMIEVTHLRQVHKDFMDYINDKCRLIEELEQAKKLSSEKAWTLTIKASSLKAEGRTREDPNT